MKNLYCLLIMSVLSLNLSAQNAYCGQFPQNDKFNLLFCDDCTEMNRYTYKEYNSNELDLTTMVPEDFRIVEFYKDNKILIFDSLAAQNYQSISIMVIENRIAKSLDAFFLEYVNNFVDNFILTENQFFNYDNFYSPNYIGKYFYRSYEQDKVQLFELSIFYFDRPKVYVITFAGRQKEYYDLLCKYLPVAYSFKILDK